MSNYVQNLRRLALAGAFSALAATGAVAADVVCKQCVDTSDIAKGAVSRSRLKVGAVSFSKLNAILQQRIIDLETAANPSIVGRNFPPIAKLAVGMGATMRLFSGV